MPIRVRYARTELTESESEIIHDVDQFEIMEDNTIILYRVIASGKRRKVGIIHRERWESVVDLAQEARSDP